MMHLIVILTNRAVQLVLGVGLYVNVQSFAFNLLEYYLTQTVGSKLLKLIKNCMNHHRMLFMLLTAYNHINVLSIWVLNVA